VLPLTFCALVDILQEQTDFKHGVTSGAGYKFIVKLDVSLTPDPKNAVGLYQGEMKYTYLALPPCVY